MNLPPATSPPGELVVQMLPYEVDITVAAPYLSTNPLVLSAVCDGIEEQTGERIDPARLPQPQLVGRMAEGGWTRARKYRWAGHLVRSHTTERTPA